jgi:predicted GNAT family N-acyltransferase
VSVAVRVAAPGEHAALLRLRHEVFCVEQGVPVELERDALDAVAIHLVAVHGDRVIGTCRLVPGGDSWTLGRMAVRADRRAGGVGRDLLAHAHTLARDWGAQRVTLSAQVPVQGFYGRQGYISEGDVFMDAGIPHIRMRRELT